MSSGRVLPAESFAQQCSFDDAGFLHKSGDRLVSGSRVADVSDTCKSEVFHRGSVFPSNEYPELDNPAAHLSQIELMNATCLSFFKSKTALGQFARESLKPVSACIVQGGKTSLPSCGQCPHLGGDGRPASALAFVAENESAFSKPVLCFCSLW